MTKSKQRIQDIQQEQIDDEIKSLIQKRKNIELKVAKFQTFLNSIDANKTKELVNLKLRMTKFEILYDEYTSLQDEIELLDPSKCNDREVFENLYFDAATEASLLVSQSQSNANVRESKPLIIKDASELELPPITLPTFDGSHGQWLTFYESFCSLIHNDDNLNDLKKLYYLKSCLKDEAANIINTLVTKKENYAIAIQLLIDRYDNKGLTIKKHINAMFELPDITKPTPLNLRNLIDNINLHLKVLKNQSLPTEHWDVIIIFLMLSKLDFQTRKAWEERNSEDIPRFDQFITFLNKRCKVLESLDSDKNKLQSSTSVQRTAPFTRSSVSRISHVTVDTLKRLMCSHCKQYHSLFQCEEFKKLSISDRIKRTEELQVCKNCLRSNHSTGSCRSSFSCRVCRKRHNSLLHIPVANSNKTSAPADEFDISRPSSAPHLSLNNTCNNACTSSDIMLSTALVQVSNSPCRALLDVGSSCNFITLNTCKKLDLKLIPISTSITGIGKAARNVNSMTRIPITSRFSNFSKVITCLVLDKITNNLPLVSVHSTKFVIPRSLQLADPNFNVNGPIDILLGADIFWEIVKVDLPTTPNVPSYLHYTQLGWVIGGAIDNSPYNLPQVHSTHLSIQDSELYQQMARFWELEGYFEKPTFTKEEVECEEHFMNNFKRDPSGRYIVRLPLKSNANELGDSKLIAQKRYYSLETKLNNSPNLKQQYKAFIDEYINLGHMELVSYENCKSNHIYYLPHHAVIKESSVTTKLRVVFDGSAKPPEGLSLNQTLMVGPTIQDDLFTILVRFRTHQYVLAADITKMYRQILVHPDDIDLQRILWRDNPNEALRTYRLKTVTYGTSSAPFLAIRSLRQLALDNHVKFKLASDVILRDFYVDNLLTGSNDLTVIKELRDQLTHVLSLGGFELRQWASNNMNILQDLKQNSYDDKTLISLNKEGEMKTLGILWNCHQDSIKYSVHSISITSNITKRSILSITAQLFDPLGLLGPVLLNAKLIIQELWKLNLSWDDTVPDKIAENWRSFIAQLPHISNLAITRNLSIQNPVRFELHGFCDASERAYGACIYLKSFNSSGDYKINLICSKSKVAPLKTISIPRLELCAAVLLSKLIKKLVSSLTTISIDSVYYWTDSMIVLHWLAKEPSRWKVFVANRVSEIQTITSPNTWHYINTKQNPADLISRGLSAPKLREHELWWNGPQFLRQNSYNTENMPTIEDDSIPESRNITKVVSLALESDASELIKHFEKYSDFHKLQRIFAYCKRFAINCKHVIKKRSKQTGTLTCDDLNASKTFILKNLQTFYFSKEICNLQHLKPLHKKSTLFSLNPFVDKDGLLRVGGRLRKSDKIDFNKKHPIILPSSCHITRLIIKHEHLRLLHAGPLLTLASLRNNYWPISGKNAVKQIIHNCIKCYRASPKPSQQLMSDLPKERIEPARPFINCGVDYAGPFLLRQIVGRAKKMYKAYVSIFVCFSTKAVHIELVNDLTTEGFLNALRRFISRRGHIANIYSDNATNFVGSDRKLNEFKQLFASQGFKDRCLSFLNNSNIKWHFIPPSAPHFGGLWEAAVKSCKYHMRRVIGEANLTYDEMYTLLVRIEACLNSRPLTSITNDVNDPTALTPGHFLIGDSLSSFVEPDLTSCKLNTLARWQYVERLRQEFWKRWSLEYIHQLQQRPKWKSRSTHQFNINDLVIIKEDNMPPLRWTLGRIVHLHPGHDSLVRTVTIKTANAEVKRPISKICVVPNETFK